MNNDTELHVELAGSKLPMIAILGGTATIFASIVFSTIWLTKLDDRVLVNAEGIARAEIALTQQAKILIKLDKNLDKQTFILENLVEDVKEMHINQTDK